MWEWRRENARNIKEVGTTSLKNWKLWGREGSCWRCLLSFWQRQMMVSRAFHQEKKFRRTEFGEEIAISSFLNDSHLHSGKGMFFRELWMCWALSQTPAQRNHEDVSSLLKSFANSCSYAGWELSGWQKAFHFPNTNKGGTSHVIVLSFLPGGDSWQQLSAQEYCKSAVLTLL